MLWHRGGTLRLRCRWMLWICGWTLRLRRRWMLRICGWTLRLRRRWMLWICGWTLRWMVFWWHFICSRVRYSGPSRAAHMYCIRVRNFECDIEPACILMTLVRFLCSARKGFCQILSGEDLLSFRKCLAARKLNGYDRRTVVVDLNELVVNITLPSASEIKGFEFRWRRFIRSRVSCFAPTRAAHNDCVSIRNINC